MITVLVTGGTGTLGRALVPRLAAAGHGVRVLTRRPYAELPPQAEAVHGDLATGAGLASAGAGVDVVVHLASDPQGDPHVTDVEGTRRLLAVLPPRAHVVYLSIIGVDRNPLEYYQAKLAAEELVRSSGRPWSVLRAAQFHEFVDARLHRAYRRRIRRLAVPRGWRGQPVAVDDVAARLTGMVRLLPRYAVENYVGPRAHTAAELAEAWLGAHDPAGRVVRLPVPGGVSKAFRHGSAVDPHGQRGRTTFEQWLAGCHATPLR